MDVVRAGEESEPFTPDLVSAIKAIWADKGTQEAYVRRSEFQLNDSAK